MSLGPPFDDSGANTQHLVGAGVMALIFGMVAWVLFMSGRTLGSGISVHVRMATAGPLRAGDQVRMAGMQVGEIRRVGLGHDEAGGRMAELETFIATEAARRVRRNAQFFVSTPSVLGEAALEIGPPALGAAPDAPLSDGERVRGADPPDLDRFFTHAEACLHEAIALSHDTRAEMDELLRAIDSLLTTLSGLPADRGQLSRIAAQGEKALATGAELMATVREAGGFSRVKALGHELGSLVDEIGPELSDLGFKLEIAQTRLEALGSLFSAERKTQLRTLFATLSHVADMGRALSRDVAGLVDRVERGQGTLGALLQDRELYDDLHETHRIIKSQPLRFFLKPSQ